MHRSALRAAKQGLDRWGGSVALCCVLILSLQTTTAFGSASSRPGIGPETASVMALHEAVGRALSHNHGLASAKAGLRAATWASRQAKARLLPAVSLESSYTRLDDQTVERANAFGREITMFFPDSTGALQPFTIEIPQTVFRDGFGTSLQAQLLLFNPAVLNGVGLAGAARDVAESQVQAAIRATVHQTVRAYVEVLKMHSLSMLQEQHAAQADRNLAQARRLADVGRYGEADVLRWQVEVAQQQGLLADTRRGLRLAGLSLENLMGMDPSGRVRVDSVLPAALTHTIAHYRHLDSAGWEEFLGQGLDETLSHNPQKRVLEGTQRLARREHRQSLTSFLPSLTLAGSYGWQTNDTPGLDGDRTWAFTAAVSVPVFTSFSNYAGYQTTKFRLRQAREGARDAWRGLLLSAESARTAIQSAAVRLKLAEVALASARRNFEIQGNRFSLGRLGNLEWIDANLALRAAEQGYHTSYYDLVLAIADYHEATGEILALLEE